MGDPGGDADHFQWQHADPKRSARSEDKRQLCPLRAASHGALIICHCHVRQHYCLLSRQWKHLNRSQLHASACIADSSTARGQGVGRPKARTRADPSARARQKGREFHAIEGIARVRGEMSNATRQPVSPSDRTAQLRRESSCGRSNKSAPRPDVSSVAGWAMCEATVDCRCHETLRWILAASMVDHRLLFVRPHRKCDENVGQAGCRLHAHINGAGRSGARAR